MGEARSKQKSVPEGVETIQRPVKDFAENRPDMSS
jgi:hypothetical protein